MIPSCMCNATAPRAQEHHPEEQLLASWGSEIACWSETGVSASSHTAASHDWESAMLQLAAPQAQYHTSTGSYLSPTISFNPVAGSYQSHQCSFLQAESLLPQLTSAAASTTQYNQHQHQELLAAGLNTTLYNAGSWGNSSLPGSGRSTVTEVVPNVHALQYNHHGIANSITGINREINLYDHPDELLQLGSRCREDSIIKREYGSYEPRLGLHLGLGRAYDDYLGLGSRFDKRWRLSCAGSGRTGCFGGFQQYVPHVQAPLCQAEGCKADLGIAKHYHRRHKVCEYHSKAATVRISGQIQRFCQQCSRFHDLSEFDDGKRSCRKRLAEHNRRRRKAPACTAAAVTTGVKCLDKDAEMEQSEQVDVEAVGKSDGTNLKEYAPETPPPEHRKLQGLPSLEQMTATTSGNCGIMAGAHRETQTAGEVENNKTASTTQGHEPIAAWLLSKDDVRCHLLHGARAEDRVNAVSAEDDGDDGDIDIQNDSSDSDGAGGANHALDCVNAILW